MTATNMGDERVPDEPAYLSLEDVQGHIRAVVRDPPLMRKVKAYAYRSALQTGHPRTMGDDLVQEALARSWEGARRWRSHLDPVRNLASIIRSLLWNLNRSRLLEKIKEKAETDEDDELDRVADVGPTPEESFIRREFVEKLLAKCRDGGRHRHVLMLQFVGCDPDEITEELGITRTELETIQRAIRRARKVVDLDE